MAAIAQGIYQVVAYGKQAALGTKALAASGKQLPRTTFDMNLAKNTFQSNRINTHQQASGTRHGTQRTEGAYNDEISCGTHKDLWAALLRGPWTEGEAGVTPGALFVPQAGHTDDVFTFEGWRSDIAESRVFADTKVTQAQISVQPNGMATVGFTLMGRDMEVAAVQYFTAPAPAVGNTPASGAVGEILVDGVAVAVVTGANITINGNGSVGDVIGSKMTPDVFRGIVNVTGDFSLYHKDKSILEKYLNEATIAFAIKLDEPGGTDYIKFSLPLVTITGYTMQDAAGAATAQCQFNADMNEAGADAKAKSIVLIEDTRIAA